MAQKSNTGGGNNFACLWENCTAYFSRAADLERHYATVHCRIQLIDCKYGWCGRTGDRGFTRRDHYTEHLREVHRENIPKVKKSG